MKIKLLRQPTAQEAKYLFKTVLKLESWAEWKQDFIIELNDCLGCLKGSSISIKRDGSNISKDAVSVEQIYPSGDDEFYMNQVWDYLGYLHKIGVIEIVLPKRDENV